MASVNQQAIDNILSRRSIRRFDSSRPVDDSMVRVMLECACAAPSGNNYRPWHFIVINDRETLDAIAEMKLYAKMLKTATLAIAICSETEVEGRPIRFWEGDCSAAMQNVLLSACALGLGSVWLGVRRGDDSLEDRLKTLLDVPDEVALMAIAAIGWPLETKDPHRGIDPHSLHINKW